MNAFLKRLPYAAPKNSIDAMIELAKVLDLPKSSLHGNPDLYRGLYGWHYSIPSFKST